MAGWSREKNKSKTMGGGGSRGRTGEGLCPVGFSPFAGKMESLGTVSLGFLVQGGSPLEGEICRLREQRDDGSWSKVRGGKGGLSLWFFG